MAKDAELDRLKSIQDTAYARKQTAYKAQDHAWNQRRAAGDVMHEAFKAKQDAYDSQQSSWERLQQLRDSRGPRIDTLNRLQEAAFQNMTSSFHEASLAHDRRDGAAARTYADAGHAYKAESQGYVAERRQLVEELRSATAAHKLLAAPFQAAKMRFAEAKHNFESRKQIHEQTQREFRLAKEEFDAAVKAFQARLAVVKSQNESKKNDKRTIAQKAGVPYAYLDKVWISKDSSGNTNIYFGGAGEPNGPGHGHYVVDPHGKVTYKRDPFDPHGSKNFVRDEALERKLGAAAMTVFHRERSAIGPRTMQFHDGTVTVKVRSGFNRKTNSVATDVIVIDRSANPDEHMHLILSEEDGSVLFQEWRKNH